MKILLTAFDAFGGETLNAAGLAVEKVKCNLAEIRKLTIPTVFHQSVEILKEAVFSERPDVVLCMGQAGGRSEITPERVAINCMDAKIADNAGNRPVDEPIRTDGPAAYFSTLPIRSMVEEMKKAGIPANISNTAGTFVCNRLMYGLLDLISTESLPICGGFMHVPLIPEQGHANLPSLPLDEIVHGIELSLSAIVKFRS